MLIVLSGLPGTGKTTIARELARQLEAVYVRIDSIEQAIRRAGHTVVEAGYLAAYAVAEDNLRLGHTVVADCVNPLAVTRDAWLDVANRTGVSLVDVEVTCSDRRRHRERVETRTSDIQGLRLPTWQDVLDRDYRAWDRARIVIDTSSESVEQSVAVVRTAIENFR
jgi:predicted kinase